MARWRWIGDASMRLRERAEQFSLFAGPLLLLVSGASMMWWSWGKWPDIVVDFGKEIYIAWQLAAGKTLYTDIAYFNGPLSPYLNSLWFSLFGVSFRTLAVCNIGIAALILAMLYRFLTTIASRIAATAAGLVFILLFAFGQFTVIGNYNYVCPITHEMNHGMALSLAAILFLSRYHTSHRVVWIAASGLALGLVFLTRAEFFVAAAAASLVGITLILRAERPGQRRRLALCACFLIPALAAPAIAFLVLSGWMSAGEALLGTLGNWPSVLRGEVTRLPFYRRGMGIDHPLANAARMLVWTFGYAALFGPIAVLAMRVRRSSRWSFALAVGGFVAVAGSLIFAGNAVAWENVARPLPLIMLGLMVVASSSAGPGVGRPANDRSSAIESAARLGKDPGAGLAARSSELWPVAVPTSRAMPVGNRSPALGSSGAGPTVSSLEPRSVSVPRSQTMPLGNRPLVLGAPGAGAGRAQPPSVLLLTLAVFALALLLKIVLHARIYHYGFAHAMPATLLTVAGLVEWLPAWIDRKGGSGAIFRTASLGAIFALTVFYLEGNADLFAKKTYQVGTGSDTILADERGRFAGEVLGELARRARPSDTLAVLPEGAMLNYLSRHRNSTPYPILMPTEMTMFGEDRLLAAFRAQPPDYIALVHRDTSEFGVPFFGRDYARRINSWITDAYDPVFQAGATPFRDTRFGILLLRRRTSSP